MPIVFPTPTARPKPTPSMRSKWPLRVPAPNLRKRRKECWVSWGVDCGRISSVAGMGSEDSTRSAKGEQVHSAESPVGYRKPRPPKA